MSVRAEGLILNIAEFVISTDAHALALEEASGGRLWSHGELRRAAGAVQTRLDSCGVAFGDRVAVFAGNRLELFAAWLGITAQGAVVTSVNLLLGPDETRSIVESLDPTLILALPEHLERARNASTGVPVLDLAEASEIGEASLQPVARSDNDIACIAYTSGTSGGLPKGAVHSHGVLRRMIQSTVIGLGLEPGDQILAFLPQFQLPAMVCSPLSVLPYGGSCLLFERLDVHGIASALQERAIRHFSSVPTALYDLATHAEHNAMSFGSLRLVTVGGAPVAPVLRERARRVGIPVGTVYGSTECAGGVAVEQPSDDVRPGSCGRPVPGIEISIRDKSFEPCPSGVDGEVCIGADRALVEYWRNPEATASSLRDGWFRTGDVGRFDDDGRLYVVDRLKDLIIRGGFNISPAEVERAILTHPDVAEVAVLGRPDQRLGEVPVAFVVAAGGRSPDPETLRAHARSQLGAVKTPVKIEVVDGGYFPRSALGKVQKVILAQSLGWK